MVTLARARDIRFGCVHTLCVCPAPVVARYTIMRSIRAPAGHGHPTAVALSWQMPRRWADCAAAHSAAGERQRVASPPSTADNAIGCRCTAAAAAAAWAVWSRIRHGLVAGLPAHGDSPLRPAGGRSDAPGTQLAPEVPTLSIWLMSSRMPELPHVSRHLVLALCLWLAPQRAAGPSAGRAARAAAWSFCGSSDHVPDISPGTRLADSDPAGIGCFCLPIDRGGCRAVAGWLTAR
jgi:hypothetical protein